MGVLDQFHDDLAAVGHPAMVGDRDLLLLFFGNRDYIVKIRTDFVRDLGIKETPLHYHSLFLVVVEEDVGVVRE